MSKSLKSSVAIVALTVLSHAAGASEAAKTLLTAKFEPRAVEQIEAGDFHFTPGQPAPVHTHAAPAIGYVAKGSILYQVEGRAPQLLKTGDAFYEPVGPRILRFDNASASDEAIFIDINLQRSGEPFIVFPKPPAEKIDRRTLPTTQIGGQTINQVDVQAVTLKAGQRRTLNGHRSLVEYVAEGEVEASIDGKVSHYTAGQLFSTRDADKASVVSRTSNAKLIAFEAVDTRN